MRDIGSDPERLGANTAPLFGRREQRHALALALDELASGRATEGVLYRGLVGAGRSALLAEAAALGSERGWLVAELDTRRGASQALHAAATAVTDALRTRRPGALTVRALQESLTEGAEPDATAAAVARRLGRQLAEAAEECRTTVLLVVDDADRWGEVTAGALNGLLAPARRALPLLTVASILPGIEPHENTVVSELGPLDLDDLADVGLDLGPAARQRLAEASGGWPAVVRSLLGHPEADWPILGIDYFEQITAALRPAERRYLEAVVSLGPHAVPIGTVAKALGDSTRFSAESSTLAGVRATLVERGLLQQCPGDRVDIALGGYREHLGGGFRRA